MTRQDYIELRKIRHRSAILFALILHLIVAIVFLFIPYKGGVVKDTDNIKVEWVKEPPRPPLQKLKTKPPLKMRIHRPDEDLARKAKKKFVELSPHKMTEVVRLSERILHENLEMNDAALSENIPDLMTDANLRESERSNLEPLVSRPGRTDGQGKVTGRARVRGRRSGLSLVDSLGNSKDRLIDGGGNPGIADKLDIIKFINEFEGPQYVVYCLDISASMQAIGLRKLELAIQSTRDSMLMLGDDDYFNIVTFSAEAKLWNRKMAPAEMGNIEAASKYLDRFTPERIANNQGTNILGALEKALEMNSSIIVLVTDGLPTKQNKYDNIEDSTGKILESVSKKNVNHASIYVVGLEIDLKHSRGAELLVQLTDQNNGQLKLIDSDLLVKYSKEDLTSPEF